MAARYQSLQRDKPRAADFQEDRRMQPGSGRSEVAEDYGAVAQVPARVAFRRAGRMSVGRAQLLNVLEMTLEPLVLVLSLWRSEEHTSELQSHVNLVCRLLLEKKKKK